MQTPAAKFGPVAIALHWVIAMIVAATVILALYLDTLDLGDTKNFMLMLHKSIGLTIFTLMIARVLWRLRHPAPALPVAMTPIQRVAAHVTHAVMYLTLMAMPITGYISVASRGRETMFFGLFTVPRLSPLDRSWSQWGESTHDIGQYALYGLVALHVGAVVYHEAVLRDGLLDRMWPSRWGKALTALRIRSGRSTAVDQ